MGNQHKKKKPTTPDQSRSEAAYGRLEQMLRAISRSEVTPPRVDVQTAALVALGVVEIIHAPDVWARMKNLATINELEIERAERLGDSALAAWYARGQYLLAAGSQSDAQLPAAVVATATDIRARMMRLVEYYLHDDPVEGTRIEVIRAGTGYLDLANDLHGLAEMYVRNEEVVSQDQKHYRASDPADARRTHDRIVATLSSTETPDAQHWKDIQFRAWALLQRDYEEVQYAGFYLFRRQEPERLFPSLIAAARRASSGGGSTSSPEDSPPVDGAPAPATP